MKTKALTADGRVAALEAAPPRGPENCIEDRAVFDGVVNAT